ncbi:hypothetical protein [Streptomyces sp. NPDC005078]|uniref:Imm32 family immunity protein n=1 Tax=unclassified Streptomyces TaxID=2593676 RepID=UPI0033A257E5
MIESNLTIRHSRSFGEVEISGPVVDLEELANALGCDGGPIGARAADDPNWYFGYLLGVQIRWVANGRVDISIDELRRILEFTGSEDSMAILAGNIRDLCREGVPGEHMHVEYFPDHFYLAESGISLIFSRID